MFFPERLQIMMCAEPVDMRKGYNGLEGLVRDHIGDNPGSGTLYVFYGKRRDSVKIFYWHGDGYAIWSKRLQRGVFRFPRQATGNGAVQISKTALRMLLDGLDLSLAA
jgi:transposase